jgi:NitT/TauT family transport system permease protein
MDRLSWGFVMAQPKIQPTAQRLNLPRLMLKQPSKRTARQYNWLPPLIAVVVVAAWYLLTRDQAHTFLVAAPEAVGRQFISTIGNGTLLNHMATTLTEIAIGLVLGIGSAFLLGYGIAKNRLLEKAIGPYAVGFQAVPIIAIAPVLIRIFGPGIISNGIVCALIVFFPMLINTIVGMRNVDPDLHDLMRSLLATRWQLFIKLEVPAALPVLLGGLKISATLAVIGAVVGEAVSAQAGLGFLIYSARYVYDTSLVLVGVFTLTALALGLYELVVRVERRLLKWQEAAR